MANTAEGFHRAVQRILKFLENSRSSIRNNKPAYVALDQKYIMEEEMNQIKQSEESCGRK